MRPYLFFLLLFIAIENINAQELSGIVKYNAQLDFSKKNAELKNPNTSLEKKKQIEKSIQDYKAYFERSYILTFNKYESIYKIEEKLGLQNSTTATEIVGDYYKNLRERIYIQKLDIQGTILLESDRLPDFDWKLLDENIIIGNYTCFKAVFTKERDDIQPIKNSNGGYEYKATR